jgi:putative molybdopterin biosynthesis protein
VPADIITRMSVYLHDIPLADAQSRFKSFLEEADLWHVLGVETIPLDEGALGRVTAEPIWAKVSSPNYHAAAMDGFAVTAEATRGAQPAAPRTLSLGPGSAQYLDTGDPLPGWANAIIPIENVESLGADGEITHDVRVPQSIRIRASIAPWSYVRPLGEDVVATQLVLPSGLILGPFDLGAVAAAGHAEIKVARKPRVAILPTGSELVPIGSELKRGEILEFNSLVLAAQLKAMGAEPTRFPITRDDFDSICAGVKSAADQYDLILLNAGSSAGAEDYSASVIHQLGTVLVHGVAVRPGHPVILGAVHHQPSLVPIIGVPGYPVSAAMTIDIFVKPLISKWLGSQLAELPVESATLTRKIVSPAGDEDHIRVAVGRVGGKLLAAPLTRAAGVITSLAQADGIVILGPGLQGMAAGETVPVHLYRTRAEVDRTIFCVGSHDLTLDLLAQYLAASGRRLASSNVGSLGGLIALQRRQAHLAGSHLLDPQTGEYNISYVRQYMPGIPVLVIALVGRDQGLLVRPGNPKHLKSLNDLSRQDVQFVNRQRGAGTRVLLDFHLNADRISTDSIQGYNQEEYTHLGVAAAVASGRVDCGLGIAAAAQALDLEFVPLFKERYDLVIPTEFAKSHLLGPLFDVLKAGDFREAVSKLAGYDVSVMGTRIMEDE